MLTPKCIITVGNEVRFTGCYEFSIKHSIGELSSKGTVQLPTLTVSDSKIRNVLAVRKNLKVGSKITIEAGYEEYSIQTLFNGYITAVKQAGAKTQVDVEDEMYMLRKQQVVVDNEKDIQLKSLLQRLLQECKDINLTLANIADFKIDTMSYQGSFAGLLALLQKKYFLTIHIDKNNRLYVGEETAELLLPTERKNATIKATYGKNIVAKNLTYVTEDKSYKVAVQAISPDGKGLNAEGENTLTVYKGSGEKPNEPKKIDSITDSNSLQLIANQLYRQHTYEGYNGTITLFGIPQATAGGTVIYRNDSYREPNDDKEEGGSYFVKAVETTFKASANEKEQQKRGLRQLITMGYKL